MSALAAAELWLMGLGWINGASVGAIPNHERDSCRESYDEIRSEFSWVFLGHLKKEAFFIQLVQQTQIDELFRFRLFGLRNLTCDLFE